MTSRNFVSLMFFLTSLHLFSSLGESSGPACLLHGTMVRLSGHCVRRQTVAIVASLSQLKAMFSSHRRKLTSSTTCTLGSKGSVFATVVVVQTKLVVDLAGTLCVLAR
jgi:hypothetical protein